MNATSRDLAARTLEETIAYQAAQAPSSHGSDEVPEMPNSPQRGQYRYAFGSGTRPLDGYTIKRAIGRGGFGEVYYATSDAGKEVALKLITRNLEVERRGVQQCMNLKSQHLITIFDMKTCDAGDTFVVMEYVAGPSLANILAKHPNGLPLNEVRLWLKGLVEGVAYLHDHGIVHRDLKPANLFLEEGVVKIGDYGLSKAITNSQEPGHSESVGTCHYMAPEIASGKYHKPIDIYAMGIIIHEMITGRVPFDGESVGEVLMKHLTAQPDVSRLPEPYRSLVRRALSKDPNHRPERVLDLLPAEDAPKDPAVRFIGDGKESPPSSSTPPPKPPTEEVLHIEAEESIFYIGPDTMPPRPQPRQPRDRRRNPFARHAFSRRARQPEYGSAVRRPTPPPPPPPEPPPVPSTRLRVAELASSMLWATPLAALAAALCLPIFPLGGQPNSEPSQLAYLFGITLLGTWAVLIPSKLMEGHSVDMSLRRLLFGGLGLALGAGGFALGQWSHVPLAGWESHGFRPEFVSWSSGLGTADVVNAFGFATYFGLVFGLSPWGKLTVRDRPNRFRFLPIILVGLISGVIGLFWPSPQPWGVIVTVLVATVAQLASPWNRQAAEYSWAMRRQRSLV